MKNIAERLAQYADDRKVIHSKRIQDPALYQLAVDSRINGKIREALKEIDPDLELYIPRQIDDAEKQFKRQLQYYEGLKINLSRLKRKRTVQYKKLRQFGKPAEVLKRWGLEYEYDRNIPPENFKKLLEQYVDDKGRVKWLYAKNKKLYKAIYYQARKEGMTIKEYIEKLGFRYKI